MLYTQKETLAALRAALAEVPPPRQQTAFLRRYRARPGTLALIWRQLCYLRARMWLAVGLALAAAAFAAGVWPGRALWTFGAVTPFLAVTFVAENGRSYTHGMAELEMAAAFPLRSILLARMALLGALHMALLALFTLAACRFGDGTSWLATLPWPRVAVYLLLPYLLTAVLGLALSRHMGRDAAWPCLGVALAVAAGGWALGGPLPPYFTVTVPAPLIPALLAVLLWQLRAVLKQTEELPCS